MLLYRMSAKRTNFDKRKKRRGRGGENHSVADDQRSLVDGSVGLSRPCEIERLIERGFCGAQAAMSRGRSSLFMVGFEFCI